jgi:hypothetical protein
VNIQRRIIGAGLRCALLGVAAFLSPARASTDAPPGIGQAGMWVMPCREFDRQTRSGKLLDGDAGRYAALCQGAFNGITAVNYVEPPYLPFCVGDEVALIDYVRAFLAFMDVNPQYANKQFGWAVLTALGRAYPKSKCNGG